MADTNQMPAPAGAGGERPSRAIAQADAFIAQMVAASFTVKEVSAAEGRISRFYKRVYELSGTIEHNLNKQAEAANAAASRSWTARAILQSQAVPQEEIGIGTAVQHTKHIDQAGEVGAPQASHLPLLVLALPGALQIQTSKISSGEVAKGNIDVDLALGARDAESHNVVKVDSTSNFHESSSSGVAGSVADSASPEAGGTPSGEYSQAMAECPAIPEKPPWGMRVAELIQKLQKLPPDARCKIDHRGLDYMHSVTDASCDGDEPDPIVVIRAEGD